MFWSKSWYIHLCNMDLSSWSNSSCLSIDNEIWQQQDCFLEWSRRLSMPNILLLTPRFPVLTSPASFTPETYLAHCFTPILRSWCHCQQARPFFERHVVAYDVQPYKQKIFSDKGKNEWKWKFKLKRLSYKHE